MNEDKIKELRKDPDGLLTYEYIANNIDVCFDDIDLLVDNMINVDTTGQFLVSAARYLNAIDPEKFHAAIDRLVAAAIDKDRERRYIGDLLESLYGADYQQRAEQLSQTDNNFRRIYKRLFTTGI
jgi:uncharacterized membrane-anchored protein YjiN (DUF445 family)